MDKKAWVIVIIVVLAIAGVAFLYFYSPSVKNDTQPVPGFDPLYTNQTPQLYRDFYTGVLNGSLSGYLFSGVVTEQYQGLFNGSFTGYGWIGGKPVYFSTVVHSGRMSGSISGQHKGNEFIGNILANVENAEMNGTVIYLPYEEKEPVTFWTLFKQIWWVFLLAILLVVIIWIIIRFSGGEDFEKHTITEIDLSVRPILEDEPYDREIKRFVRSRPVPNSIKPKYHQILYECKVPNAEFILVDAQFGKVLRVHTDISGPDVKKMMDETQFVTDSGAGMPYRGYGYGYRPRTTPSRSRRQTPRRPPSGGLGGEFEGLEGY